jgi:di/tricarboxylate transporter
MPVRWRWFVPLAAAGAIWLVPHAGFSPRTWGLLCLFAATVCGLITRPLPSGAVVLVAITAGALLRLFRTRWPESGTSRCG